jgi:hypothetical protein
MSTQVEDRTDAQIEGEEERIESRSAVFKKELALTDLVLTQILFIVGLPWVGVAARQGPSHVVLWLAAMVLFYIPSAAVVIYLNRSMPLEGGITNGPSSVSTISSASLSHGIYGSSPYSTHLRSACSSRNISFTSPVRRANHSPRTHYSSEPLISS